MDEAPIFQCHVCQNFFTNPYVSLNRNTQQHGTDMWQGKVRKTINIALSQEMFRYCSQDCWELHAPTVAEELKLKTTYPPSGSNVPCCRCGRPVDRTLSHISYVMTEMNMEYGAGDWTGHVVDDKEFAILCSECEEPGDPAAEAADELEEQKGRTRA
jgi:hypothetical protein